MTALPDSIIYVKKKELFKDNTPIKDPSKVAWNFKMNCGAEDKYFYIPDEAYARFTNMLIKDIKDNKVNFPIWQCLSPMFAYFQLITLTESQKDNKEESIKKLVSLTFNQFKKYTSLIDELKNSKYVHVYYAAEEYVFLVYPYFFVYEELAKLIHDNIKDYIISPLSVFPLVPRTKTFEPCRICLGLPKKVKECFDCMGSGKGRIIEYIYQYSILNNEKYIDCNDDIRLGLIHAPFEARKKIGDEFIDIPALDGTVVRESWNKTEFKPYIPYKKKVISPILNIKKSKYDDPKYKFIEDKINKTLESNNLIFDEFKIVDVSVQRNKKHVHNIKMKNSKGHVLYFSVLSTGHIRVDIENHNKRFKEKELIKTALEKITDITNLNSNIKRFENLQYNFKKRKADIYDYINKKKKIDIYKDIVNQSIKS